MERTDRPGSALDDDFALAAITAANRIPEERS
jgi:hypothetical protein